MAKKNLGLLLLIWGIVIIIATCLFDLIARKGEIILGPKSYTAITIGAVIIIAGILSLVKNKKK